MELGVCERAKERSLSELPIVVSKGRNVFVQIWNSNSLVCLDVRTLTFYQLMGFSLSH